MVLAISKHFIAGAGRGLLGPGQPCVPRYVIFTVSPAARTVRPGSVAPLHPCKPSLCAPPSSAAIRFPAGWSSPASTSTSSARRPGGDAGRRGDRGRPRPDGGGLWTSSPTASRPASISTSRSTASSKASSWKRAPPRRFGPPAHDQRGKHSVIGELRAPRGLGAVEEFERLQRLAPAGPDAQSQRARARTRSAAGCCPTSSTRTATR